MSLTTYLKDTRAELKHVNWPTRAQATSLTLLVILLSLVVAALLGVFDSLFTYLINLALNYA